MREKRQSYVIGIDGGGTRTIASLADLRGKIIASARSGPSSPRNVGITTAAKNIAEVIQKIALRREIISVFIGLPAVQEEYRGKKAQIRKEILRQKGMPALLGKTCKLTIGSDQFVAFMSGSGSRDGMIIIAGTGCAVHGWYGKREVKVLGWGWLDDGGSGFWTGHRVVQAVLKDLDDRGARTVLTQMVLRELEVKRGNIDEFLVKLYGDPTEIIPRFAKLADTASRRGDRVATEILKNGAQEIAVAAAAVIRKLGLQSKAFPVVLVGGMFKSPSFLRAVKRAVKKGAPKATIVLPKKPPVAGAVTLALWQIP